jgi:hypothetical protein
MLSEDIEAGLYYRHTSTGRVVKVLHPEVWPAGGERSLPRVVYRQNDDEYPHRFESLARVAFAELYEGPLGWDAAVPGWKDKG